MSKVKLVRKGVEVQNIVSKLYAHQLDFVSRGLCHERRGYGGILGAEMGTGKTLMMLSLFGSHMLKGVPFRTLVVCPLSLLENWHRECRKHMSLDMSLVSIYHGVGRSSIDLSSKLLVITSYDTLRSDWKCSGNLYEVGLFKRIVLDEGHEIKNVGSQRYKSCMSIGCVYRWVLSGTPIQNSLKDLKSLCKFVGRSPYKEESWWLDVDLKSLRRDLYIYYGRSNLSLPSCEEKVHKLTFSESDRKVYNKIKCDSLEIFEEYMDDGTFKIGVLLTKLLRLRQYCNHSYGMLCSESRRCLEVRSSPKFGKLLSILRSVPKGESVLIFSQFRNTLDMLGELLRVEGYKYDQYHGGQSVEEKSVVLGRYDKGVIQILLMSLKAGGVGLNLVRGNHVILFDPWWNRALESQALSRVHRIGQTREVKVHRLIMSGTIEEWIECLQSQKLLAVSELQGDEVVVENCDVSVVRRLFEENCY